MFFCSDEELPVEDPGAPGNDGDSGGIERGQSPPRKKTRVGSSGGGTARGSRGQGRAGNRRDGPTHSTTSEETPHVGFEFLDKVNVLPPFAPRRPLGVHFEGPTLRGGMTTELDFFRLFFTRQIIGAIVAHTNSYAHLNVGTRGYHRGYVNRDGSWNETSVEEMEKFVALLIYFSLVEVSSDTAKYWSTKSIYHGLWARKILPRHRYQAIASFLHVVDPANESPANKLRKVDELLASFKEKCKILYQPAQKLAVDERMVKSKHRSGIKQTMNNKPIKHGLKLWVLADSSNGYTADFNVYIGKDAAKHTSEHGLSYDVVMELMQPFLNQGYHLYLDNFYTSPQLVRDLFLQGTPCTGTVKVNRKDFPECLSNAEKWAKLGQRGDVRWVRHSHVLALQWVDCKPVSILTTLYSANDKVSCKRKVKKNGVFSEVILPQPLAIHEYNQFMNGVDRSDQMLAFYNVGRKCYKWWKTLFFHLIDITVVNSFLLFQTYRDQEPDMEALHRPAKYALVDFREALVRQLLGWPEYDDPPVYEKSVPGESQFETGHMPEVSEFRRNCVVCYREGRGQKRISTYCGAPQCRKFLHIQPGMNCFKTWHSPGYQRR